MATTKKFNHRKQWVLLAASCLLILIGVFAVLKLTNTIKWPHSAKTSLNQTTTSSKTTSHLPTAQSSYSGGTNSKTPQSNPQQPGGVTDTKGQSAPTSGNPVATSDSGVISLYQPAPNSTIHNGDAVSGTATADTVQFRLVDNNVGVIAEGSMKVVNGKFSGRLSFQATGKTGVLELFTTNPSTQAEANRVNINVNF